MRPRELTVRGFRSYAEETRFRFAGRGLVGIVGPIGAGKSSILDAVSFALYAKTPKIERDTKSLIGQRRDELKVEFVFEVDGIEWRVVRALRRTTAQHALYRLDGDGPGLVADKKPEVDRRIEELLGLDFGAFRRSVLLAKYEFTGFLDATPADRNQVLKGVFGFDRLDAMRAVVKTRLELIGVSLQHLGARRATAEADRRMLDTRSTELASAELRVRTLEVLRVSVFQAEEVLREAEVRARSAAGEVVELDGLATRVPTYGDTQAVFGAAAAADRALEEAERALDGASTTAVEAAAALESVVAASGGRKALQEGGELVVELGAAREAPRAVPRRHEALRADQGSAAVQSPGGACRRRDGGGRRGGGTCRRRGRRRRGSGARCAPRGSRGRPGPRAAVGVDGGGTVPGVPPAGAHTSPSR